ncbi:hypothetical protein SASPL_150280 [Salvia splendens]|uniref:NmrA-like domain-containing protein n=1 Tax=Salvia splendens TaxID=180675 RepID=A0A8X8Z2I6_SALSN|nr:hypothetical protein SASPL_150280 [Salvia splendens]
MARPTSSRQLTTAPPTATTTALETSSSSNQQRQIRDSLLLKLKLPKKKVSWKKGTVDNEFMNKKSSKKCCIFHKEKPFDEDDSDAECDHDHDHDHEEASTSRASLKLGHPTYVFSRPNSSKTNLLNHFQSLGAIIVKGMLDEHEKLVSVIKEVDVVISAVAYPQILDQLKILEAIKRFLASGYGVDEDKEISVLPAFESVVEKKRRIRRAIEEAIEEIEIYKF